MKTPCGLGQFSALWSLLARRSCDEGSISIPCLIPGRSRAHSAHLPPEFRRKPASIPSQHLPLLQQQDPTAHWFTEAEKTLRLLMSGSGVLPHVRQGSLICLLGQVRSKWTLSVCVCVFNMLSEFGSIEILEPI